MSFRCGFCSEVQPTYSKPIRIVTKIRARVGNKGFQIAQEKAGCKPCASEHTYSAEEMAVDEKQDQILKHGLLDSNSRVVASA